MQLPPVNLLFALPYVPTCCFSALYLCTFQLYYGLGYVRPATHFLGRTDPYYTVIFYSSCGLNKRPVATLALPLSVSVLSSQYLFQRGAIWIPMSGLAWSLYRCEEVWGAVFGPYAIERYRRTFRKEKGISPWFPVSIWFRYDLSCWKRRETHSLLHSFLQFARSFDWCYTSIFGIYHPYDYFW